MSLADRKQQAQTLLQWITGGLTGDREVLEELAQGNPEPMRAAGEDTLRHAAGAVKRAVQARPRTPLNKGHTVEDAPARPTSRPGPAGEVMDAEFEEDETP